MANTNTVTTKPDAVLGFTPGPWDFSGNHEVFNVTTPNGDTIVARVLPVLSGDVTANTRLIAAAPQLYSAAMSALVYLQSNDVGPRGQNVISELMGALTSAAD